jgi:hypothetical protein
MVIIWEQNRQEGHKEQLTTHGNTVTRAVEKKAGRIYEESSRRQTSSDCFACENGDVSQNKEYLLWYKPTDNAKINFSFSVAKQIP